MIVTRYFLTIMKVIFKGWTNFLKNCLIIFSILAWIITRRLLMNLFQHLRMILINCLRYGFD